MYRLENNVEWTDNIKNAFKHGVTKAKFVYDNIEINYDNGLKDLELKDTRYVPDLGFIGQAVAKQLTINMVDNEQTTNLENKELTLYIGADYNGTTYYINYGNFIVDAPPENDSTNGTIKIVAYDYMIKFNKLYVDNIIYPCTLRNLLLSVCNQAGVTLADDEFTNQSFVVENNQFEGKTLREVLQNIAKCAFSWARIGQDNKLYLDFQVSDTVTETITINDYKINSYKKANEYYGAINKVTYGDSDIVGQEESVTDDADIALHGIKELVINDNYFAYTTAKRQALIQGGSTLFGLKYMPISQLDMVGLIYLDCNDIIEVEDEEENTITSRVFSHIIKYNGAVSDSVETEGISINEQTYENRNTTAAQNSKTEISVDRANKKIQNITSQIGDRSQKTTTITQDIDGIESKVEDLEDLTKIATGIQTVTISDAYPNEDMLELHIYGNNSVFDYLYPADDLYPADNLYPYGDSRIRFYNSEEDRTIELNIMEVLRANLEVKDEVLIDNEGNVSLIRRVNADGTTKTTPVTTVLGELHFKLVEGDNTFEIVNYNAPIEIKYATKSTYTEIFATKVEMNSSITQTAEEINLEVSKKVDENEFGTLISQNAYNVKIAWNSNTKCVQFEGDGLTLYDGSISNINKRAVFNFNGNSFYRDGYFVGQIVTSQWSQDNSHKGLSFQLNSQGKFMSWSERELDSGDYYTQICYSRANTLFGEEGLHFGANMNGHWNTLKNVAIGSISAGGYNGYTGAIRVLTGITFNDEGLVDTISQTDLQVRNGIIVGTWID